jgi:hypothetical protein
VNTDVISDAIAPAIEAAHECVARAAMLADLASSLEPSLAENARLASISASFKDDISMDEALAPLREHVADQLRLAATTFDGSAGDADDEAFHLLRPLSAHDAEPAEVRETIGWQHDNRDVIPRLAPARRPTLDALERRSRADHHTRSDRIGWLLAPYPVPSLRRTRPYVAQNLCILHRRAVD